MRLYVICKRMKWTHLPNPGGLYQQHPKMLDDWFIIMGEESKADEERQKKNERQQRPKGYSGRGRRGRRK